MSDNVAHYVLLLPYIGVSETLVVSDKPGSSGPWNQTASGCGVGTYVWTIMLRLQLSVRKATANG
jgi:hypothetical protein